MKSAHCFLGTVLAALSACGGGGGSSTPAPPPPPAPSAPTALSYPTPPPFTYTFPITPLTPAVTGTVANYNIAPALPPGLAFNTSTGVISGTPIIVTPTATYTITAGSSLGSTTAAVTITVNDRPPDIRGYGPAVFMKGVLGKLEPFTNNAAPMTFAIDRAPPAGTTFDPATGTISGRPTTVMPRSDYSVTISNSGGTITVVVPITVVDFPPSVSYARPDYRLEVGVPIRIVAGNAGGDVVTWSLNRALPAGLTFDAVDGSLSGTPTQATAITTYDLGGENTGAKSLFPFSLGVVSTVADPKVLLDLGHTDAIAAIVHTGNRILSTDGHHTVLWDAVTGQNIATDDCSDEYGCPVSIAMAGPTAVVPTARLTTRGIDVWSSAEGTRLSSIALPSGNIAVSTWWKLASDGSYIVGGNRMGLTVWSPTGNVLWSRAGDYGTAQAFAAPGELRIANGLAGTTVIENLALPAGTSTLSAAFSGNFHSWFGDGESFLTVDQGTVRVYSNVVTLRDTATLPTIEGLAGQRNWFWTHAAATELLRIYKVGASASPSESYTGVASVRASTGTIAALNETGGISVIDLAGASLVRNGYVAPQITAFASTSSTDWAFASSFGALFGELGAGPPARYALGRALDIAGSSSRFAILTASGSILSFSAATLQPEGEIDFRAYMIDLSADGTVLAAANVNDNQGGGDQTLRAFSMPSQTVITEWPATGTNYTLSGFAMARSGTVVIRTFNDGSSSTTAAAQIDGTPIWSNDIPVSGAQPSPGFFLSPDGNLLVTSSLNSTGNIYLNGTLNGQTENLPLGWIGNDRLLVGRFGVGGFLAYDIVGPTGQVVAASFPLPTLGQFELVSPNTVYSSTYNAIHDVNTAATLWSSATPSTHIGSATPSHIIFGSGTTVGAEPR